MTVRGKELAAAAKPLHFAKRAEHFKYYVEAGDWLAAYVVAFSFLEDRVGAMYAERCEVDGIEERKRLSMKIKVSALEKSGDLDAPLANRCHLKIQERDDLFHNTMWNLDRFTKEAATDVEKTARDVNNARDRQARAFAEDASTP